MEDIDIRISDSGRTMILDKNNDDDEVDGTLGDMDFGGGVDGEDNDTIHIKSERSIPTIGTLNSADMATITERSLHDTFNTNTERSNATMGTIDTIGTADGSVSSSILDTKQPAAATVPPTTSHSSCIDVDDDEGAKISAPASDIKFQPLQPLPGSPSSSSFKTRRRSSPRKIPNGSSSSTTTAGAAAAASASASAATSSSAAAESPENGFMHNMVDPVATATTSARLPAGSSSNPQQQQQQQQSQLSHTPPTDVSTSYETSHFGKRARAGVSISNSSSSSSNVSCHLAFNTEYHDMPQHSNLISFSDFDLNSYSSQQQQQQPQSLSERLLASTELEEKGIINRDQKGILKDLIISGQDNELQHALDRYEQGDSSILEGMLQTGTLSNKAAVEEIDLLGALNFDFLNVKDQQQQAQQLRSRGNSLASNKGMMNQQGAGPSSSAAVAASDGIGELDFDGGIGNWEQHGGRSRSNSNWSQLEHALQQQQRSRANSTVSIDLDTFRNRSNSLFSSLIGNEPADSQANYGRWMDPNPPSTAEMTQQQKLYQQQQDHQHHFQQLLLRQQQQRQQQEQEEQEEEEEEEEEEDDYEEDPPSPPPRRSARRASAPASTKASKKEQLKEQKRRERLLKKEQKEREKLEKKQKREQAKLAKQKKKKKEEQVQQEKEKEKEREEHVPGSGRPRSMSDPNLKVSIDEDGLTHVERPEGWIGAYSPDSRKVRIARFLEKRNHRVWTKTVKYDVRKNFADSRLRVKGRFVKKEDELLMRELMSLT